MQPRRCHCETKRYKNLIFVFLLIQFFLKVEQDKWFRLQSSDVCYSRHKNYILFQLDFKRVRASATHWLCQTNLIDFYCVTVYTCMGKKTQEWTFPPFWGHLNLFMVTVAGKDWSEGGCHWDKLHHEVGQLSWACSEWMIVTQLSCHLTADSKSVLFFSFGLNKKQTPIESGMWVSKSNFKQN